LNSLHRRALTLGAFATSAFNTRGSFPSNSYTTAQDRNAEAQAALIDAIAKFTAIGGNVISTLNAAKTILDAAKTISDAAKTTLDAHG